MSKFVNDIADMHRKFGVNEVVSKLSSDQLVEYFNFRVSMIQEEVDELKAAKTADDAVDALIDAMVFIVGTLDVMGVDANKAWDAVHTANMSKSPGVKATRPNKFGFPDLIKPVDFKAPSHVTNVGRLEKVFD